MRVRKGTTVFLAGLLAIAVGSFFLSRVEPPKVSPTKWTAVSEPRQPTGSPQLISVREMPDMGEGCTWEPVDVSSTMMVADAEEHYGLFAGWRDRPVYAAAQESGQTGDVTRPPVRMIRDTDPIYSSVAVDPVRDEVVLQDNNLWATRIFNRLDNTPPDAKRTEPKRVIEGVNTEIQFSGGLYVDPKNGDIYSIEADTGNKMTVFSHDAHGNVAPKRHLKTPHRGYALAVDEANEEIYVSVEYPPKVLVYRKGASDNEEALRRLEGDHTGLEAAHGIAVDSKGKLMFINNWGNASNFKVQGSGKFNPPSIAIYSSDAKGDTPPMRVIQGPKTQLNWAAAMAVDPDSGEIYIANDVGQSILVFKETDQGDVAPTRVIKGSKTGLRNPTGVSVDLKNKEVWASNLGNSSATVYPLNANGDVAPLRIIRSAPIGKVSLKFGKTESVAYDSKRQELLVPNCVNHPQIAAFSRLATENTPPTRTLEGQKTLISRTMHDLAYDPAHDEIVVTSPLTQAILVFRGGASGEEPPVRVIQGPHTQILGVGAMDKVTVDPETGEIYLPTAKHNVVVFPYGANGDVAPKRVLGGPDTQIRFAEQTDGSGNVPPIRVDPVHNLLIVPSGGFRGGSGTPSMLIFDRNASGNTKPLRVITGPKTALAGSQQIAVTPKGWILGGASGGSIGIWNINDSGDAPPRWKIPVRQITGLNVNGVGIDATHQEVMIPTGNGNVVMTFYFPEIF